MIGRQNSIGRLTSRRKQRRQNDQNAISSVYRFAEGEIAAIPRSLRSPTGQTKHERGRAVDNRSSIHELHRSIRLWPWIIDRSSSHEVGERFFGLLRAFLGVCAVVDGSIYISGKCITFEDIKYRNIFHLSRCSKRNCFLDIHFIFCGFKLWLIRWKIIL